MILCALSSASVSNVGMSFVILIIMQHLHLESAIWKCFLTMMMKNTKISTWQTQSVNSGKNDGNFQFLEPWTTACLYEKQENKNIYLISAKYTCWFGSVLTVDTLLIKKTPIPNSTMKSQISWCLLLVWSEPSFACLQNPWILLNIFTNREGPNQPMQMFRLIWTFAVCIWHYGPFLAYCTLRKHAYSNILNILTTQKWKFSDKNLDISQTSGQNIDCGYSLEPCGYSLEPPQFTEAVLTSSHNLCFWAEIRKIMYTPVNPSFTI